MSPPQKAVPSGPKKTSPYSPTIEPAGWAEEYVRKLLRGETVEFRPTGFSMSGRIESGQLVRVAPMTAFQSKPLVVGDIVLCRVGRQVYLHLIKAIRKNQYLIGNNRGGLNGWTSEIYGRVEQVERLEPDPASDSGERSP